MENLIKKRVKEKRFELILQVFDKINFERVLIPEEYSKDTFYDFLKWKIGNTLGMRYDKQLSFIYSQKSEDFKGFDAVISIFGVWEEKNWPTVNSYRA